MSCQPTEITELGRLILKGCAHAVGAPPPCARQTGKWGRARAQWFRRHLKTVSNTFSVVCCSSELMYLPVCFDLCFKDLLWRLWPLVPHRVCWPAEPQVRRTQSKGVLLQALCVLSLTVNCNVIFFVYSYFKWTPVVWKYSVTLLYYCMYYFANRFVPVRTLTKLHETKCSRRFLLWCEFEFRTLRKNTWRLLSSSTIISLIIKACCLISVMLFELI